MQQNSHPHVPHDPHFVTPLQYRPDIDHHSSSPIPIEIDTASPPAASTTAVKMPTFEELQALAAQQSDHLVLGSQA